jgi:hypothetical protein
MNWAIGMEGGSHSIFKVLSQNLLARIEETHEKPVR